MKVITDPAQATPRWLTDILRREGILSRGEVNRVQHEFVADYNSAIHRLILEYSSHAPANAPTKLILKLKAGDGARDEFDFGTRWGPDRAMLPMLLDWYDAAYSPEQNAGHFLMRDLTVSHVRVVDVSDAMAGRSVPADLRLHQIVDTVAHFHAHWWMHPRLTKDIGAVHRPYLNDSLFESEIVVARRKQLAEFVQTERDGVPADWIRLHERALENLPRLYARHLRARFAALNQVTLVHGDCYLGQFFCPKDPARERTYMIDLESANTFIPGLDLSYLFATFWTRAQRKENDREMRCLQRYAEQLCAHGVRNFSFEHVLHDYRVAVALMVFHPIWDKVVGGSSKAYWWPKMQCLIDAFQDLNCEALLEE